MEKEENNKNNDDLDWEGFLERMRLKKSEAARLIGAAPAMMTDWIKRETYPSHKYLKMLCLNGMTAQEMFGKEAGDKLIENSLPKKNESFVVPQSVEDFFNNPKVQEGLQEAFNGMMERNKDK